jgi:hypothetical protein
MSRSRKRQKRSISMFHRKYLVKRRRYDLAFYTWLLISYRTSINQKDTEIKLNLRQSKFSKNNLFDGWELLPPDDEAEFFRNSSRYELPPEMFKINVIKQNSGNEIRMKDSVIEEVLF